MTPTVSVIIPVLNNCIQLQSTLKALSDQSYPSQQIEILVVDNGSDEDISDCISNFNVKLIRENFQKSPYAARNSGINSSIGDIIAFTDANKTPAGNWIDEGVRALFHNHADAAGGNIIFTIPDKPTASEVFDSVFSNNNRNLVLNEKAAATGNLFVRRQLFDSVGRFHGEFRSGMDVWWTQRAVRYGFKLIYADKASVYCVPRKYRALMKKAFRVGKSHPFIRREAGDSILIIISTIFRTFSPPRFKWLNDKNLEPYSTVFKVRLWVVAWSYKCFLGFGRFWGLLSLRRFYKNLESSQA